jgi:hypothetical protein
VLLRAKDKALRFIAEAVALMGMAGALRAAISSARLKARTSAPLRLGEGLMSHWKSFGLALFAAVCLLGAGTGLALAKCDPCAIEWSGGSVINLGGLPGSTQSVAQSINAAGQAVGDSTVNGFTSATG